MTSATTKEATERRVLIVIASLAAAPVAGLAGDVAEEATCRFGLPVAQIVPFPVRRLPPAAGEGEPHLSAA